MKFDWRFEPDAGEGLEVGNAKLVADRCFLVSDGLSAQVHYLPSDSAGTGKTRTWRMMPRFDHKGCEHHRYLHGEICRHWKAPLRRGKMRSWARKDLHDSLPQCRDPMGLCVAF